MCDAVTGDMTPILEMTPNVHGMMTPQSAYPLTPSAAGFSPRIDGVYGFDSPGYQSPSPAYGTIPKPVSPSYAGHGY